MQGRHVVLRQVERPAAHPHMPNSICRRGYRDNQAVNKPKSIARCTTSTARGSCSGS
jgi:hypothetical protein